MLSPMASKIAQLKQRQENLMFAYMAEKSPRRRARIGLQIAAVRVKAALIASFSKASGKNPDYLLIDAQSLNPAQTLHRARVTDKCMRTWEAAKTANDFKIVAPALQEMVDSVRLEARVKAKALGLASPYHALLACKTPGFDIAQFETWCAQLEIFCRAALANRKIENIPAWHADPTLGNKILALLGHANAVETAHPLCLGTHGDTRIGLRANESDSATVILNALHEGGHASLRKNLPANGRLAGVGIDETCALIIENHAGKGYAFATYLSSITKKPPMEIYQSLTALSSKPIRTSADEVRYPLDVILRYRLEKDLIDGNLKAADIPAAWAREYKRLTGMDVKNDNEGALQDVHWFGGEFGWFPNYLIGQLVAAQLYAAAYKEKPEIPKHLTKGDFTPLTSWLNENIYRHGARWNTFELIERATGKPLGTAAWERHIKDRYHGLFPVPRHSPWRPS